MKSIKTRLAVNFMLVILISVCIFEILLISFVKRYYYRNVEEVLINQIKISSNFYSKYFSDATLEDNILNNIDVFWNQTSAEVQVADISGRVLMDSIGALPDMTINTNDFKKALSGEIGKWVGKADYGTSNIMIVSSPLTSNSHTVGVLRFITSLTEVDKDIVRLSYLFLSIGAFVIAIAGFVSLFLSNSIINPIKEVTAAAEQMASGNLTVKSQKKFEDEIGRLSDTLNFMSSEILKKDQLKNDFISSVSHELRTPLTAIKGWAITLNSEELADRETLNTGLNIIEKESDRLTAMVEELLDFSKFISGKVELKLKQVNLTELIIHIETYMKPRAVRENISFHTDFEDHMPYIMADENRIEQVVLNILDNAFKFTNPGGNINISVNKDKNYAVLSITDTGCGISKDELPKVKEKFYKGKNSNSKNGIGLSISDEIVKMHNGALEIESSLNVGTTVRVKLPAVEYH